MATDVLALQGDVVEHARALEGSGARALLVRRVSELDQVDGLVIPSGELTTISNLLLSFGLFNTLNGQIASSLLAYDTCAGTIMLASSILDRREDQRSFGALDMVVRRNASGRQVDSYEEDLDVEGVKGGPFHAVFIRTSWAELVGESIEVIACAGSSTDGLIVGVHRGSIMTTLLHPEVGGDDRIHATFVDMVART